MALDTDVVRTVERLAAALAQLGVDYRIIGGVAVHAHGWKRNTEDVDVIVTREGHRAIFASLVGHGYLPKFHGSKHLRDTTTRIAIDFLVAGRDRPGSGRGPVTFPDPGDRPHTTADFAPDAKVIDLERLIDLKLLSYHFGQVRDRDLSDVVDLLKVNDLPLALGTALHPDVRPIYEDAWRRIQRWRIDPGPTEHAHEPTSPYFAEAALALERGEITVAEALARLTLP